MEVLKYLHEHGCPWNDNAYDYAALYGNLDIFKYLYENGCPWNADYTHAHGYAEENGYDDILKYIENNIGVW